MIFYQKLFKKLQSFWNVLSEKGEKQDKFVIYLLLIEVFVIILILGIKEEGNLAVALGTISMALAIVYIEIIKPWLQKPEIKVESNKAFCLSVISVPPHLEIINEDEPVTKNKEPRVNLHYHIRLKVTNKGKSVAKRVRGKLINVEIENKDAKVKNKKYVTRKGFDPVFLHWSSVEIVEKRTVINLKGKPRFCVYYEQPNYLNPLDLSPKEYDYLEIIYTGQELCTGKKGKEEGLVKICTSQTPRGTAKNFGMNKTKNTYILSIVISGENIEPATEKYKLVWNGEKYDEIEMEPYKENSKTIEKAKCKCAK